MLTLRRLSSGRQALREVDWRSPVRVPRGWLAVTFAVSAVFAGAVAVFTTNELHRLWGLFAVCAYLLSALAVLLWRSRGTDVALIVSLAGALVLPLSLMVVDRLYQPEVAVIDQSASLLVRHGTPYLGVGVLAATHNFNLYDPYLPVMTAFGLPRALAGFSIATDPRIWFGVAFVVLLAASLALTGGADVLRWTALVTASPVIAFSLSVGGTDVPVLACQCLGLALLWRRPRPIPAGLALGAAAAMKATAWPALVVAAALLLVRDGRRHATVMCATALAVVAAVVGPVAVLWPRALLVNTIEFPLGLTHIRSPAASPLPGRLLAETGHIGHLAAVALLVLAGLAIAVSLVVRPPRTVPSAAWRLIIGLSLMIVLAPATRFGYFLYPVGLLAWLAISQWGAAAGRPPPARPAIGPVDVGNVGVANGDGRPARARDVAVEETQVAGPAKADRPQAYQSANHLSAARMGRVRRREFLRLP